MCNIEIITNTMPLNETGEVNSVNARDLHEFLEIDTRFNDWIADRIQQYGFTENLDFVTFTENPVKLGRPPKEYAVTLDMAKELSMVERTPKGREARQYFIRCEKALHQHQPQIPDFTDPIKAAEAWLEKAKEANEIRLALEVSEEARKVAVRDRGKISNHREATAVGKIGGLTSANNALKEKVTKLETEKASDTEYIDRLNSRFQKYVTEKPKACQIPKERPSDIKKYHVDGLIQEFAYVTKREIQEVRREVYGIFNRRAKGFNIFVDAKRQNVAIIEAIRRRGLMDKLYDIVIECMEEFNHLIPEPEEPDDGIFNSGNSGSFTGIETVPTQM